MTWTPDDVAALRATSPFPGPTEVALIPDRPPLLVNLDGIEAVQIALEEEALHNPFLAAALDLGQEADAAELETLREGLPDEPTKRVSVLRMIRDAYDAVLALLLGPAQYVRLRDLQEGARPPDKLSYHDFPPEARALALRLLYQGTAALVTFRGDASGDAAVSDGEPVRPAAGGPADPARPAAPEVLAQRSDLDAGPPGDAAPGTAGHAPAGGSPEPDDGATAGAGADAEYSASNTAAGDNPAPAAREWAVGAGARADRLVP